MPPDGGLLYGLGVADLRADPWLFYMLITSRRRWGKMGPFLGWSVRGPGRFWLAGGTGPKGSDTPVAFTINRVDGE